MNSLISILVGVVLVLGVGGFVVLQKNSTESSLPVTIDTGTNTGVIDTQAPSQNTISPMTSDDNEEEFESEDEDDYAPAQTSSAPSSGAAAPAASNGIPSATVASHNSRASCWSIINGSVYDLTSWIPKHPGGEQAILGLCGTDGSAKFNRKHGGDASKEKILFGFKIGALAQ